MKNRHRSLYIHVPFCQSKCRYCDFYSFVASPSVKEDYLTALKTEISLKGTLWGGDIRTLYIGGGTPSCLSLDQLAAVLKQCGRYFSLQDTVELTLEMNPGSVSGEYLRGLKELGVNRLSIGLQAMQEDILQCLGRAHSFSDFLDLYCQAGEKGFSNISVDAMFGLPGQSLGDYLQTLQTLVSLGVSHISAYGLQLESGTELYDMYEAGRIELPPDEAVVEMMLEGSHFLQSKGYLHYEISNFALPGYVSQHNMVYWKNEEYIGCGPGAASYVSGRRFSNGADIELYVSSLGRERLPVTVCEQLNAVAHRAETAILALRLLAEGLDRAAYATRFGTDPVIEFKEPLCQWLNQGMLTIDEERIRLTPKGMLWLNQIQASLLPNS